MVESKRRTQSGLKNDNEESESLKLELENYKKQTETGNKEKVELTKYLQELEKKNESLEFEVKNLLESKNNDFNNDKTQELNILNERIEELIKERTKLNNQIVDLNFKLSEQKNNTELE